MSFGEFCYKIRQRYFNEEIKFFEDTEKGMMTAFVGDFKITANRISKKATVRWGSGHQALVTL